VRESIQILEVEADMAVNWKKKIFKPEVVLDKIANLQKDIDGFRYIFEYYNATAALCSMIEFPSGLRSIDQETMIHSAVHNAKENANLTRSGFIEEVEKLVKEYSSQREEVYHLLTSISLDITNLDHEMSIENCHIRLLTSDYPKKFSGREESIKKQLVIIEEIPADYTKVIVAVKAKSEKEAALEALRVLDIQRAIWCLLANPHDAISFTTWGPINNIRLGSVHTIHADGGAVFSDGLWYEPNFARRIGLFSPSQTGIFQKSCLLAMEHLNQSPYKRQLIDALLRYVRALDEGDPNTALMKLWGALEVLTAPSKESNYDLVTRRCSAILPERNYHKQILEHLREYRNANVHSGYQNDFSKINCLQMQSYFHELIFFHLKNENQFKSLKEANDFLDLLSSGKEALEDKKRFLEKAIAFVPLI